MKRYTIEHVSEYEYTSPAALSLNDVCLSIRPTASQTVLDQKFWTEPTFDVVRDRVDFFGNRWKLFAFEKPHRRLEITSSAIVDIDRKEGDAQTSDDAFEAFLYPSKFVPLGDEFARLAPAFSNDRSVSFDDVLKLTRFAFDEWTYDAEATTIDTSVREFVREKRGVCQDFAHATIAVLRSRGIPARYVSGYLDTIPPPGKPKLVGVDASHAWISVYFAGQGWIDFDPTNGIAVGDRHIAMAWGRDYADVTPLKGVVLGGGAQKLNVKVTVLEELAKN